MTQDSEIFAAEEPSEKVKDGAFRLIPANESHRMVLESLRKAE